MSLISNETDTLSVCVFVVYGADIALIGHAMGNTFFFLGTYCSDKLSKMDYLLYSITFLCDHSMLTTFTIVFQRCLIRDRLVLFGEGVISM